MVAVSMSLAKKVKLVSERRDYLRLFGLLQRLMRILHTHARHYSLSQKVSLLEFQVLFILRSGKPVEMGKIKKVLSISGAFATTLADRLVNHKLVDRQRNAKDRRKVTIALTEKGRNYLAKFEAHRKQFLKAIVNGLKEEDKRMMERGVSILVDSLESLKDFNV